MSAKYKVTAGIGKTARRPRRGGRYYSQKQRYNGIFTPVHIFSGVCCTVRSVQERGLKQGFTLGTVKNEQRNWTELNWNEQNWNIYYAHEYVVWHSIFCWPCISVKLLVSDKLDAKFLYIIDLFQSFTCFEQTRVHHQEVNCINNASGIVTLCKWPSGMQVEQELYLDMPHYFW